jgi:exosome complex component RRP4
MSLHVLPGEEITREPGYLRGHGTVLGASGRLVATVAGVVERINSLVSVRALAARYAGEVGDVVVGRVVDVQAKRWRVDVRGRQDATLLLSSVNLVGGAQRRRTAEDQLHMRDFFAEDDLVSAEIHSVFADGSLSLHARSLEYGRLENGTVVAVPPALMRRLKAHFVSLPCGVDAILGLNGVIWLTETPPGGGVAGPRGVGGGGSALDSAAIAADAGHADVIEAAKRAAAERDISGGARLRIARVRNAILALAAEGLAVTPDAISLVFAESERLGFSPAALLEAEASARSVLPAKSVANTEAQMGDTAAR